MFFRRIGGNGRGSVDRFLPDDLGQLSSEI